MKIRLASGEFDLSVSTWAHLTSSWRFEAMTLVRSLLELHDLAVVVKAVATIWCHGERVDKTTARIGVEGLQADAKRRCCLACGHEFLHKLTR